MTDVTDPNVVDLGRGRLPASARDFSPSVRRPMTFYSILFESFEDRTVDDAVEAPEFFSDLNCDKIVDAITAGKEDYNLKPFFYACLHRVDAIKYRHEVMRDLESPALHQHVTSFAQTMREIRDNLARVKKLHYREQQLAWFLDAVEIYCRNIRSFADNLSGLTLTSHGFQSFRDYLVSYATSGRFSLLASDTKKLEVDLAKIQYCVQIRGNGFTVRKYDGETDYSAEVEETFKKFKQGAVSDYSTKFTATDDMNHIEATILQFVAKLHPEVFLALKDFYVRHVDFIDRTVAVFDREVQFYIAYLQYIAGLKGAGLEFCYPRISSRIKEICDNEGFDIALAHKLVAEGHPVVCNEFCLKGKERVIVVSGPNQGGKTTFARAFGQLHYLASIGCPVPGREAQLFLFDRLLTHFEKEEKVENLRGKLEDDLVRIHQILSQATPRSIIIMNEIFTSTTIQDETFLSKKVMGKIIELGSLCVWVTFVDELASYGSEVVSMLSTIVPDNPTLRTFKVLRRPPDGLAYAMAIAQKYGLTYDAIRGRIKS
jgi:DNA mismatch repair protein MutS